MTKEKKKTILIVEDEAPMIRPLTLRLKKEGFSVIAAKDGLQGLVTALAKHPNLILLDIIMPNMDGFTMLQKLREDAWGKTVPVIILTNLSDSIQADRAMYNSNIAGYLVKTDWSLDDVVKKVKEKIQP